MTRRFLESNTALILLLLGATLLRIVGVGYGLPLTLVADEPPFVLGALQMLQLHTFIPSLHEAAFQSILYYPPYLCYLYIAPFVGILGVEYLFWQGDSTPFALHALANLSPFFITARILSVAAGIGSIYLLYQIGHTLFRSRMAAFMSAFLFATSLLAIGLSMVGRHWNWVTLFFLLVLYILTRAWPPERRVFWIAVVVGVGMGVSTFIVFALLLPVLWFMFEERLEFRRVLHRRLVWFSAILFTILATLPTLLYHNSSNYLLGALALSNKSLTDLLLSPLRTFALQLYAEPVLIGAFVIGLVALFLQERKHFYVLCSFVIAYIYTFYFLTDITPRFVVPLVPFYALIGGYALERLSKIRYTPVVILLLLIPLTSALRLSYLVWHSDTRAQAREHTLEHLLPSDRVLVYGELLRLPADTESIVSLRAIDPNAVRKIDEADAALGNTGPHALSLFAVTNTQFYMTLPQYTKAHHYNYILYEPAFATSTRQSAFDTLRAPASTVAQWSGTDAFSITGSSFTAPFWELWNTQSLGPTIILYRLE